VNLTEFRYRFDTLSADRSTEVIVQKVTQAENTVRHSHDFIEIAFVRSGCGWHIQGEERTPCEPGDLYVIDLEESHQFLPENGNSLTVYNLIFHGDFLGIVPIEGKSFSDPIRNFLLHTFQYRDFSHALSAKFEQEEMILISGLFERMLAEYASHEPGYEELIRAWTVELLVRLFRKLCARRESGTEEPAFKSDALADVFAYIRHHYTENISLTKLATFAFVSPKYFSRLFKAHTGLTVSEYTQKLRIQNACGMLKNTDLSVGEIADRLGYSDVKYFSAVFRRLTGISPTGYRRENSRKKG